MGQDFASTVGTGGVVGTKFTWPQKSSQFKDVVLTQAKDSIWKKWIGIYNQEMLSRGEFRNLYFYGYDSPEGYAIEKNGRTYYAFFTDAPQSRFEHLELRGLGPGRFRVVDYENARDYGEVSGPNPHLEVTFREHLLLEVSKIQR